jgi:hypothetical protein
MNLHDLVEYRGARHEEFPDALNKYLKSFPRWTQELEEFADEVYCTETEKVLLDNLEVLNFRSFDPDYNPLADLILQNTKNGGILIELLKKFPVVFLNRKFTRKLRAIQKKSTNTDVDFIKQAIDFITASPDRMSYVNSKHIINLVESDLDLFNYLCEKLSQFKYPPYFRDYFQLVAEVYDAPDLFYGFKTAYRVFLGGWSGINSEISHEVFRDSIEANILELVDILEKAYDEDIIDTYWLSYILHQIAKGSNITKNVALKLLSKKHLRGIFLFNILKIFEDVEEKNRQNLEEIFSIDEIFSENIRAKKDIVALSMLFIDYTSIPSEEILKKVIEDNSPDKILEDLILKSQIHKDKDLIFKSIFKYQPFLTDKIISHVLSCLKTFTDFRNFFKQVKFKKWDIYDKKYVKARFRQGLRVVFESNVKKSELLAFFVLKYIQDMNLAPEDKSRLYKVSKKNCPLLKRIRYHIKFLFT